MKTRWTDTDQTDTTTQKALHTEYHQSVKATEAWTAYHDGQDQCHNTAEDHSGQGEAIIRATKDKAKVGTDQILTTRKAKAKVHTTKVKVKTTIRRKVKVKVKPDKVTTIPTDYTCEDNDLKVSDAGGREPQTDMPHLRQLNRVNLEEKKNQPQRMTHLWKNGNQKKNNNTFTNKLKNYDVDIPHHYGAAHTYEDSATETVVYHISTNTK